MHFGTFILFEQTERRIFSIKTYTTNTCLEKKIHRYRTKIHSGVHLFLAFFSICLMIDNSGR